MLHNNFPGYSVYYRLLTIASSLTLSVMVYIPYLLTIFFFLKYWARWPITVSYSLPISLLGIHFIFILVANNDDI
jgi:hypothetical protein